MTDIEIEKSAQPMMRLQPTRLFATWLNSMNASLILSTYQAGKVLMIGMQANGKLSVFERTFERPMGIGVGSNQFWISTLYQLWRFENFLDPGTLHEGYDSLFVPVTGHTTGDIDIHDIHIGNDGLPFFVVTRFNCIATLSETGSFKPLWRPKFIDRLVAEDRCHLNGVAADYGEPAFVTCVAGSNVAEGWRNRRHDGGLLIDVDTNEEVLTGLSMPHSPRLHNEVLYLLQAGTGEFGQVDFKSGRFEPICFLPGFARGLAFIGNYAVIGISRPRHNDTFSGLALDATLEENTIAAQTALCVVNLETGDVEHMLGIEGAIPEIYDVQFLQSSKCPKLLGFKSDEIRLRVRPTE